MMHVLLCIDHVPLRRSLAQGAGGVAFAVEESDGVASALAKAMAANWDLMVVGLFRPGVDTAEAVRRLQEAAPAAPILVLRRAGGVTFPEVCDVQASLRSVLGAGLLIRLSAALRDPELTRMAPLRFGDLELEPGLCRATINGVDIGITPCEYRILEHLALRRGEVVSAGQLQRGLARDGHRASSNVVAQWVSRVRTKVRLHGGEDPIATHRGLGYAFTAE